MPSRSVVIIIEFTEHNERHGPRPRILKVSVEMGSILISVIVSGWNPYQGMRHGLWLQRGHLDSKLQIAKPGTKRHWPVTTASIIRYQTRTAAKAAISKAISFEQPPLLSPQSNLCHN